MPISYTNKLMEELLYHEECTRQRFRSFAQLLTTVAMKVSREAAELPSTLYLSNNSTAVDLDTSTNGNTGEVSCQTTADTTNHHNDSVVIDIEDPAEEWERAYDRSPTDADIWTRVGNFYSFRMFKDYSVTGGKGPQAKTFEKLLCNKLAYKTKQKYNDIINYYRCKLSFLIRKLILLCIRGSRKTSNRTDELSNMDDLEFNSFESKVN